MTKGQYFADSFRECLASLAMMGECISQLSYSLGQAQQISESRNFAEVLCRLANMKTALDRLDESSIRQAFESASKNSRELVEEYATDGTSFIELCDSKYVRDFASEEWSRYLEDFFESSLF